MGCREGGGGLEPKDRRGLFLADTGSKEGAEMAKTAAEHLESRELITKASGTVGWVGALSFLAP